MARDRSTARRRNGRLAGPALVQALLGLVLAGCAAGPPAASSPDAAAGPSEPAVNRTVADIALGLRGTPYRYGGDGPGGFDCSGLVHYAYGRAGADVPRTARGQYEAVRQLYVHQLRPGDLVFFRTRGAFVSHVGIYVGEQRFVHALNSGQPVKVSRLDSDYWSQRLIRAGSLAR